MTQAGTAHHHGSSPAAWATVIVITVAFLVGAVAMITAMPWLFWVAVALVGLGLVVGKLMAMAGMGVMPTYAVEEPADTNLEGPDIDREATSGRADAGRHG